MSQFQSKISLKQRSIHPNIDHFYLIDWVDGDGLTPIVHSLKGGRCRWAFEYLSGYFSIKSKYPNLIYYPSKGKRDHAFQLASCLSEAGCAGIAPVKKITTNKQSLLNRGAREKVVYEIGVPARGRVHLADDIVTTGATALACYRALGRPYKMTVWSLFYRKYL